MDLRDKVVVITGASSGIGKACAYEFAKKGAHVVLAGRRIVSICEITADIEQKYKVRSLAVECDVTKYEDCQHLINSAVASFGKIDVLVNNAGISMRALFQNTDISVLKRVMDVNFWGTVYCTKLAIGELIKSKGALVGVSSVNGYVGTPGRSGYSASKFAMNGFLDSLRIELMKSGVHVMNVAPGFTATEIREKSLTNDGSEQGQSHMNEKKLMTAEKVAAGIVSGLMAKKRDVIFTLKGKIAVLMSKLFPAKLDKEVFAEFQKEKDPLI